MILVCLAAVSVSLPMAWISLSKVLLFVFGLAYLISNHFNKRSDAAFEELWTPRIVLAILIAFSLSLLWTVANMEIALLALVKHSKLLEILLVISLIRTAREARIGITAFFAGQTFLLLSSWLLAAGVQIPWATTNPIGRYVVFSSYLDQSIILATSAAMFWHLRFDHLWPRWLGVLLAALALVNVLLLLEGRTGYAVAVAVISLAVMWAMPKHLRLATLIATPIVVLFGLYLGSSQVQVRLSKIINESQSYSKQAETESSSGWRLNAWHRSVQAIEESPWFGHGVGSWTMTIKRLEGSSANKIFGEGKVSNPHQEYLLWGVELGIGGMLLLLSLIICLVRDTQRFNTATMRTILSVLGAMAVACMFNSALFDALMGDFFCIALGLLIALGLRSAPNASDPTITEPGIARLEAAT